jgi:hypothetical protein
MGGCGEQMEFFGDLGWNFRFDAWIMFWWGCSRKNPTNVAKATI